jgi:hypothetical protein
MDRCIHLPGPADAPAIIQADFADIVFRSHVECQR